MTDHERMLRDGYLGRTFSADARTEWPVWAAEHFAACAECRELFAADAALVRVARRRLRPRGPVPPLDLAAIRTRAAVPRPSVAQAFAEELPVFGSGQFRDNALQLVVRDAHIRAVDAGGAAQISAFCVDDSGEVRHIVSQGFGGQAGAIDFEIPADERVRIVVISIATRVDPALLTVWLQDAVGTGSAWRGPLPNDRVRVQEVLVTPTSARLPLRLRAHPYPPSPPDVAAAVEAAAQAAQGGEERRAAALFFRARDLAAAAGDEGVVARATLGIASVLLSLGFHDDAGLVLDDLVRSAELSPARASQAARAHAWRALLADDAPRAGLWLDEVRKLDVASPWIPPIEWHVAAWQQQPALVLEAAARDVQNVSPFAHALRDSVRAIALVDLGKVEEAEQSLPVRPAGAPREVLGWWEVAAARISEARGRDVSALAERFADVLSDAPPGQLTAWEGRSVAYAAGWLAGSLPAAAAGLMRTRFLGSPLFGTDQCLAVDGSPFGLVVHLPTGETRRLTVSRSSLAAVAQSVREAVATGQPPERPADLLSGLLGLDVRTLVGRVLVASDGVLAGVPWQVLVPQKAPDVRFVEVAGRGAALRPCATGHRVVSLADARGDLPLSARECEGIPDAERFAGPAATRAALESAQDAGVLHLGLHVRREGGVPMVELADTLLSPIDIGAFRFTGRPIVYLAGCASAAEHRWWGVERSLAEAFLLAGASSVVATRWPLQDAEAHALFRPLLTADGVTDVESAVARTIRALRDRGVSPRVWAALSFVRG